MTVLCPATCGFCTRTTTVSTTQARKYTRGKKVAKAESIKNERCFNVHQTSTTFTMLCNPITRNILKLYKIHHAVIDFFTFFFPHIVINNQSITIRTLVVFLFLFLYHYICSQLVMKDLIQSLLQGCY